MKTASITNQQLIERARNHVRPRKIRHGFMVGEVGCALITDKGNVYVGTSIDTSSGMGFCAEHSAIAAMLTQGEHRIKKIVAVLPKGTAGAPCGRCRELIHQIHDRNMETEIVLGKNKTVKLKTLLPNPWDK
ncbi:MAG TPA: cytidine deaminase [Candidatus Bathyarchaeia archaeon]|jgi:cytidine deaminase|nr:cytidine deaminase [Candidatus Bathyarchaeia archaeon]